ncbi:MAG: preprotein translocase subunit SecG [Fibrobacteres bacterium]|nr:preprotein translocase subunit SecG [Fibrobacterota bacterium]
MSVLYWLLIAIHVIGCLVLIGLVLLQNDKAGGISGAFGGVSQNQAFTSAGAATFISTLTKYWGVGLIVVVLLINVLVSRLDVGKPETGSELQKALGSPQGTSKLLNGFGAPEIPYSAPGAPSAPGLP